MDIEKLEKLNELKEKGIITEEEFNAQKKDLLSSNPTQEAKTSFSWKNFAISFAIALIVLLFEVLLALGISPDVDSPDFTGTLQVLNIALAIVMTIIAVRLKTSSYKSKLPAWGVFLAILFFGCIGFWVAMYDILQISQGNVELKTKN